MKLVSIERSSVGNKKMTAIFLLDNDRHKTVHFGAKGYEDYTTTGDEAKKSAYIKRHQVNENWNDPTTAGALARYILWNKPTISESIADYKRRFNL